MVLSGYSPAVIAVALLEGSNPATSSPSTDPTNSRVAVTFQRRGPAPSDLYRPVAPLPATGPPSFASQFSLHVPFSRRVSSLFISTASVPLGPGFLFLFRAAISLPSSSSFLFSIVYSRRLSLTQDATTNTHAKHVLFKSGVNTKGKTEDISQNSGFFEANTYLKQEKKEEGKKEKN